MPSHCMHDCACACERKVYIYETKEEKLKRLKKEKELRIKKEKKIVKQMEREIANSKKSLCKTIKLYKKAKKKYVKN